LNTHSRAEDGVGLSRHAPVDGRSVKPGCDLCAVVQSPEADLSIDRHCPVLSVSEEKVLELVALGLSTSEVASRLFVSPKDVEYHMGNLLRKFAVRNRTGVVSKAFVIGYLHPSKWPPLGGRFPATCAAFSRWGTTASDHE